MVRNCLKMLLCLLLVLMLPLCALADVQHTLQMTPGSSVSVDNAVVDLLDALSLKLTKGERSGALTIALEDTDIATAAFTVDTTGLYVHSNLLSDDVLYVTWDDGFAYLTELIKAQLRAEGAPESELSALESRMAEVKSALVTAAGSATPGMAATSPETSAAMAAQMLQDDPQLQSFVESIYEKMTVEQGSFADAQRDTADEKYSLTLNEEDLLKICDTEYMRSMMREVAAMVQSDEQGEALEKAADEMLEEVRQLYRSSDYELVMTMYTRSGGTELVGMEMGMNMTLNAQGESHAMEMTHHYDRLGDESGIAYKADMSVRVNGSSAVQMAFQLHRGVSEVSEGRFALLAEGEEITFQYRAENTQPDVRQRRIDLYLRSDANTIIAPAFSDRPLISFEIVTAPADPSVLAAVEEADAHNSVNVMKLSDEEMQALGSGIATRCMQALYSALAKMPTSALQLTMQLMQ